MTDKKTLLALRLADYAAEHGVNDGRFGHLLHQYRQIAQGLKDVPTITETLGQAFDLVLSARTDALEAKHTFEDYADRFKKCTCEACQTRSHKALCIALHLSDAAGSFNDALESVDIGREEQ